MVEGGTTSRGYLDHVSGATACCLYPRGQPFRRRICAQCRKDEEGPTSYESRCAKYDTVEVEDTLDITENSDFADADGFIFQHPVERCGQAV